MAGRVYTSEDREQRQVFTPSLDSDDDYQHTSSISPDYRLFHFRKEGRSWANAPRPTESTMSEAEIKKRARRSKKPTHTVDHQLGKMSEPRRMAIEDLVYNIRQQDGDRWDILAIDNENPERTKRTGEVLAFSVTLGRAGANMARQRTGSISQDRRQSAYLSPRREYAEAERRRPKYYFPQGSDRDRRSPRRGESVRTSQTILEDDPFAAVPLFSNDGKPVHAQGVPGLGATGASLPPEIALEEPLGAKAQKQHRQEEQFCEPLGSKFQKQGNKNKSKKEKKGQDDDVVDLDALLGNTGLGNDEEDVVHFEDDEDEVIEIFGEEQENRNRGRKRKDSGYGQKPTRRMSRSRSKSKPRPRKLSVHIPKNEPYGRPVEVTTAGGRKGQRAYYGSYGSATTPSFHSDQSVLEAEVEEYSSSDTSGDYQEFHHHQDAHHPQRWSGTYMPLDGRYVKSTNQHRRGPPSPQQGRYEMPGDYGHIPQSAHPRRPSRQERLLSDSAIQPYGYPPGPAARPTLLTQHSAPRFAPMTAYPVTNMYNTHDSGLMGYPSEMVQASPAQGMRRRDSIQVHDAERYMQRDQRDQDRDREMELLRRERDLAQREAEMHQEAARRASTRTSTSKYNHEPRLMQRDRGYSGGYHN